jgi:hypothetical protein
MSAFCAVLPRYFRSVYHGPDTLKNRGTESSALAIADVHLHSIHRNNQSRRPETDRRNSGVKKHQAAAQLHNRQSSVQEVNTP